MADVRRVKQDDDLGTEEPFERRFEQMRKDMRRDRVAVDGEVCRSSNVDAPETIAAALAARILEESRRLTKGPLAELTGGWGAHTCRPYTGRVHEDRLGRRRLRLCASIVRATGSRPRRRVSLERAGVAFGRPRAPHEGRGAGTGPAAATTTHSVATCFVIRAQALLVLNVAERRGLVPELRRPAVVAVVVAAERPRFHNRRAARRLVEF